MSKERFFWDTRHTDEQNRLAEEAVESLTEAILDKLTEIRNTEPFGWSARREVWAAIRGAVSDEFCVGCGLDDPYCQCQNDE
jgi:hypothetical protein